ncbi:hypothetical protein [Paracoccus onubensis]|uniref:AlgX/AlgJ SGNH hydrolase-like domain-containing protein n=1 Tax=Paracoccus onubensis TaxID=1675788 RepID=A0A418T3V0_9RHOB|nr:hypothetical protein [Paracoccus onubensis]RJE87845.1 hypothetical protein D3P04_02645 [Paracoccus onubensis]
MTQEPFPDEVVHEGGDGYLFLSGGAHSVFDYFSGAALPLPKAPGIFWKNISGRAAYCASAGIGYRHVVFPDKCVVLRNLLKPERQLSSLYQRAYGERAPSAEAKASVLYPIDRLTDSGQTMRRTDTHYSARGNIVVTSAIVADLFPTEHDAYLRDSLAGLAPREIEPGDLGRKLTPPRSEIIDRLQKPLVPVTMGSNGISGNDGIMILVDSPQAVSKRTLLIFGDSFFRLILPMLAVFYQKIVFCRTRFLHHEIVRAVNPDQIFTGQAERYLSRCETDAARPHFLSYPYLKGTPMAPDEAFCALWPRFISGSALLQV